MDDITILDKFKELKEYFESRLSRVEKDVDALFKGNNDNSNRLSRIEEKTDALSENFKDFKISLKDSINGLGAAIEALKDKPGKRWESVVTYVICAAVGIIVTLAGTALFGGK